MTREKISINKIHLNTLKHNIKSLFTFPKKKFDGFVQDISSLKDFYISKEIKLSNDFYGIANTLKLYSGYRKPLKLFIEHGLYFGNHTDEIEISGILPGLITFGQMRKEIINNSSNNIVPICIGPYINYAPLFFSKKEEEQILKQYGKILLFFPQHTIEGIGVKVSDDILIKKINDLRIKYKCDTVFISVYYRELNDAIIEKYRKNGFVIICSGHRNDPQFLSRQKSFINLSYITASNNVGTHIGYCIAMNKKHILIDDDSKLFSENEFSKNHVPELYLELAQQQKNKIKNMKTLNKSNLNYYWGMDIKLSPNEMKDLFVFFDKVYKYSKKMKVSNIEAYNYLIRDNSNVKKIIERINHD